MAPCRWLAVGVPQGRIARVIARNVTLGLLCVACSVTPLEQQQDTLAGAQARWRAAAIPNYSFELQHACFCAPIVTRPVTVTVRQSAWTMLTYVDDGTVADTALFRDFLTMDRVVAFLRGTLERHPASLTASYDAQFGYPTEVYIDYIANAADDELSLRLPVLRIP